MPGNILLVNNQCKKDPVEEGFLKYNKKYTSSYSKITPITNPINDIRKDSITKYTRNFFFFQSKSS